MKLFKLKWFGCVALSFVLINSMIVQLIFPALEVIASSTSDSTPPVLENIEVSPQELNVGDTVTIKAQVRDVGSGVKSGLIGYRTPSGNRTQGIQLIYNTEEGIWEGNYTIKSTDENGTWNIYWIDLKDNAGNSILINGYGGTTLPDKSQTNFIVNNETSDSTPPVLENIEVSPQELNVGDTVTIKAQVRDVGSGVKSGLIGYRTPSGNRTQGIQLIYNTEEGIWEGNYTIKSTDENGTWNIYWIDLKDNAGNSILINGYGGTTLPDKSQTNFIVNNETSDSTPPVLENIEVSPQELNVGDTVTIKAQVRDVGSGVKSGLIGYRTPSGNRTQGIQLIYNTEEGIWEGNYTIKSTDENGTWNIYWIDLKDNAGNSILINGYGGTTLPDKSQTNFIVNNQNSDPTPPEVPKVNEVTNKSTSVTGTAEAGSSITVKAGTTVLGTVTASTEGNYMVTIPKQEAGTKLSVIATDDAGNTSEVKEVIIKDVTAPIAPSVNEVTETSTSVTGTAEAGSTVKIKTGTTALGTVTAETDGKFSLTIPRQVAGTKLEVIATDKAGNVSEIAEFTVLDKTAPITKVVLNPDVQIGNNGFYKTDVPVILEVKDNFSEIAQIEYRINGGEWEEYPMNSFSLKVFIPLSTIALIKLAMWKMSNLPPSKWIRQHLS